jgi:hypothetical protein
MANTTYRIAPSRDGAQYSIYPAGNAPITITGSGALAAQSASMAGSGTVTGGGGGSYFTFPLPAGNAMPAANLTMRMIHPRPDSDGDINSWEKHKLHPSGIPLWLPVGVMGGIPPFQYTLSSDLSGATIGQDMPRDWMANNLGNYGVLMCANPAIGSYTHTVTIEGQDSTTVSSTFDQEIVDRNDTTKFRWYDTVSGDNAGTGSYDDPYKDDLRLVFGTTSSTSTFQGQVWIKTAGTYSLVGHTDLSAGNIRLNNATRPVILCALRDTSYARIAAVLDFSAARFNSISGGNAEGLYFDIAWDNYITTFTNFQNFFIGDSQDRITFVQCYNTNIGLGTSGTDNATGVFFSNGATSSDSTYNHYVFFRESTEVNRPNSSNSYGITSSYGIKYFLFEGCRTTTSDSDVDIYLKDSCQEGTVRYCFIDNDSSTAAAGVGGQNQNGGTTTNIEYVHCVMDMASVGSDALRWCAAGLSGTVGTGYTSRCTLHGRWNVLNSNVPGVYGSSNDVVYSSASPPLNDANATSNVVGDELQGNTAYFDADYKLVAPYAATYNGIRGVEIFD